ncbi:MAG: ATPase [Clostridia bacterium]|nr:ATPase [Clostridia bacterium]
MAIEKMKFVMVNGPSSQLGKMITTLCADGAFHPESASQFISPTMGYAPVNEENPYAPTLAALRDLSTQLGVDLEENKKAKGAPADDRARAYIETLSASLRDLSEQRRSIAEQIEQCRAGIDEYRHFLGLGVNLDEIFACRFISIRFGHLPKDSYLKLTRGYGDNPYVLFCPCSTDADGYWGAYFAPKDREDDIDRIFAALHFNRLHIPSAAGTTEEIIDSLTESIDINVRQLQEIDETTRAVWETESEKICTIYTRLLQQNSIFELRKYAVHHEGNCFFVGWIPASYEATVRKKLEKYPDFVLEIDDPEENARVKPPTRLRNFRLVRPFSYFVEMYGVPSYRDLDITAFVALTYTLLFGIMFGDVGQGLVLILVGILMWKLKKMPLGKILVPCGFSSMVFGFVFGSVFGYEELLEEKGVYRALHMDGKPIPVMDSINSVLLFAIAIGVTLVIVAMGLNVVSCVKKKKFGSALFSENGVTGICVYVGAASLAYSFMAKTSVHLPHTLLPAPVSTAMLVVGVLILFNKELIAGSIDERRFKKPDSVADYILQNLFECIEYILSYFSNTVSFLRVGAFVIVHASMMMVVFTLAGGEEAAKTPKGIIIVAIGNIVVIALEGLLSGIQGLRLEFYEMFSRFYEGEGRAFEAAEVK